MSDIRDFGDNKTIVLHTNESKVYQQFKDSKKCFKIIPYEQEQFSKKRVAIVGFDLYFPKKFEGWLEQRISKLEKTL